MPLRAGVHLNWGDNMIEWFYPDYIFKYNKLFNLIVGERGNGKTTGCLRYIINKFLENNNFQCVWIRRYKEERKKITPSFFKKIEKFEEYKNLDFKIKGNTGLINDKEVIYFSALSVDGRIKGIDSPNIKLIVFDEFLVSGYSRYLPNEFYMFLELYDSIARPQDPSRERVPVIFLSNAMSLNNPYFINFKITFNGNKYYGNGIYAEILNSESYRKYASNSEFSRIIKGTEYYKHSVENNFILDNYSMIKFRTNKSKLVCNFIINNKNIGMWIDWIQGEVYLSEKTNINLLENYSLLKQDLKPNYMTTKFFKNTRTYKIIKQAYITGSLYYESIKIKAMFEKVIPLLNFC